VFCNGLVFIDGNQNIPGPERQRRIIEGLDDGWMSDEAVFFVGECDSPVECS
jgi:hypothetical protein